jgi:uncharacterized phage protein gp47/JayE
MAGLSSAGLVIPSFDDILSEIKAAMSSSPAINPDGRLVLDENTVLGQMAVLQADRELALWQALQAVYSSQYLNGAEGASLDLLAALVGVNRSPATASLVTLSGTGTNGTVIPALSRVRDPLNASVEWVTLDPVTIAAGVFSVAAMASVTGPIAANTATITAIVTPVAGWSTVTNAADATLGTVAQSDASLRQQIVDGFAGAGVRTTSAIRSALSALPGVVEAYVYENPTGAITAFGVPAHCIEAVVDGGDDVTIAQTIYDNKAEGAGCYSATVDGDWATDANGEDVFVGFSRPQPVPIYVYIRVEKNNTNALAIEQVKTAVAAFGNNTTIGSKVRRSRFFASVFGVAGITNVTRLGVSNVDAAGALAAATTLADVVVAFREKATFDTARIVVEVE